MIPREITSRLEAGLAQFPVVALVGARQSGKTTLARSLESRADVHFFDLENPRDQLLFEDPLSALEPLENDLVVIDEAQRMPEIFPVLRVLVDSNRRPGRFLLLGSATPHLRRQSAESLAGRMLTLELTPFTAREVVPAVAPCPSLWLRGGFPPSLLARTEAQSLVWREQYLRDIMERDLRLIGFDLPPARMIRFMQMLAHNHGQVFNASQLSRSLGIASSTAGRYLDAIQQTFLVRRLPPFFKNLGKRLIKSPKVYIRDSGLVHSLLGLRDREQLLRHPVLGCSWEGFVMEQFAAVLPSGWELSFWRTQGGAEIDLLLLEAGHPRISVEIKANVTRPRPEKGFQQACDDLHPEHRWIVYPGEKVYPPARGIVVLPLQEAVNRFLHLANR